MKIHYLSHHSILEYDEVQLFTDLGHEVFSNGAYLNPAGHITLPRPGIVGAKYYEKWAALAASSPKNDLPPELIEPFDVIIVMHQPEALFDLWPRIRHKRVIWRSIGQSVEWIEQKLKPLVDDGLIIVRYSPKEANIPSYAGAHSMIRFYKDENVYTDWLGINGQVVNFSQNLKGRRDFCHYDDIYPVISELNGKIYGPDNEAVGMLNGGNVPFDKMLDIMRASRALIYGGTWPASYTLSFIEALVMGLPIVAISAKRAHLPQFSAFDFYEVGDILREIGGIVCDNASQMTASARLLQDDYELAKDLSRRQREVGIKLFGKDTIGKQWEGLFASL